MSWGQGDPNFNKILVNLFGPHADEPENRKKIFYYICIWVRLILYSSLFYLIKFRFVIYILFIAAFVACWQLISNINGTQWWSKKWQLFISICLLILTGYSIYNDNNEYNKYIPILLLISLFGGIIQSLFN